MNYFVHETAVVDQNCEIGAGTKIWHFSHIMSGCIIGESCNIGQNVVISPAVNVITSYSIHYTKLYENISSFRLFFTSR